MSMIQELLCFPNHFSLQNNCNLFFYFGRSDVYFHGLYRGSNNIFVAISSSELTRLTQAVVSDSANAGALSIFYVRQVGVRTMNFSHLVGFLYKKNKVI